ncbi:MAG: M4 family metallopeptidase [Candidatus Aminicenantales bacterium]
MPYDPIRFRPCRSFLPPYILDALARAGDEAARRAALETVISSAAMRARRDTLAALPIMAAIPSVRQAKERLVYDMKQGTHPLPGRIILREGEKQAVKDAAAKEAYKNLGLTYDFYRTVFSRNSLDDEGQALIASVHYGKGYNNAFWNGEQMVFGDGDGRIFTRFTRSLDVVGHELSHGVVTHTCNLEYFGQSGALNEHFADVFGVLTEQWSLGQAADKAAWLVGAEIIGPKAAIKAIRTFKAGKAFENDPLFGTDPQPKHMRDFYEGADDDGGVHINSGIPNHAFYRVAAALGGKAWETAGPVWYKALSALGRKSGFMDAARTTGEIAASLYGPKSREAAAVKAGWKGVGLGV